mmetsp:Transcript_59707/g.174598  ORF Transcript_59707/g.174598 Transcript_59707/m.174598 type:complete len:203 (-) Transcript_59707:241-849(-)
MAAIQESPALALAAGALAAVSSSSVASGSAGIFSAPLRSRRPMSSMNSPRSMVQSAEPSPVTATFMTSPSMPRVSPRACKPSMSSRSDFLTPSQHCPMKSSSRSVSSILEISFGSVGSCTASSAAASVGAATPSSPEPVMPAWGNVNAPLRSIRPISSMKSSQSMVRSSEPRSVMARSMTSMVMPSVSQRVPRPSMDSFPES